MLQSIVRDQKELRKQCELVTEGENIDQILADLRDTFRGLKGYGLAAPQIGVRKQVAIVYFKPNEELVLVNPKIIDKEERFEFKGEGCFSFPGLNVNTDRWRGIVFETGFDSDRKRFSVEGIESVILQHEIDHLNGVTIFDRKHKAK